MGRKKRGNVLFAKRVSPDKIPALLAVIAGDRVSSYAPDLASGLKGKEAAKEEVLGVNAGPELKAQLEMERKRADECQLEVDRLTTELEAAKMQANEALTMDLDEKGKLGWKLYYELKNGKAKGEFDQT